MILCRGVSRVISRVGKDWEIDSHVALNIEVNPVVKGCIRGCYPEKELISRVVKLNHGEAGVDCAHPNAEESIGRGSDIAQLPSAINAVDVRGIIVKVLIASDCSRCVVEDVEVTKINSSAVQIDLKVLGSICLGRVPRLTPDNTGI